MKRPSNRPAFALVAALLLAPATLAQKAPQSQLAPALTSGNAAVDYWRASNAVDHATTESIGKLDWSALGDQFDLAKFPDDFKTVAAAIPDSAIDDLLIGSRRTKCDFQIPYEQGPMARLPHLGILRQEARLLRLSARMKAAAGDAEASAQRLVAILHMSAHIRHEGLLISNLVGMAMVSMVQSETESQVNAHKLTPEARQSLSEAFRLFTGADPFGIEQSINSGERQWTLGWIKNNFHGATAGKDLITTGLLEMGEGNNTPDPSTASIALMNEAQLSAAVDLLMPYYDQALAAWDQPDAEQKLGELERKAAGGGFGPLAHIFAPALVKCHQSDLKGRATVQKALDKLAE